MPLYISDGRVHALVRAPWAQSRGKLVDSKGSSLGHDEAPSRNADSESTHAVSSDIWVAGPTRTYDHMARVARDARALLGALHANVEDLRSGFGDETSSARLAEGLTHIEAYCEKLNNMLEDALIGVRREGFTIQRSSVSLSSVIAAALRQVRAAAEARRISFGVPMQPDVAARLDRTLLTRALVKLMGRIIVEGAPGSDISVHYGLERGEVSIGFVRNDLNEHDLSGKSMPTPLAGGESDLEFCHVVAECHGGVLTVGNPTTFEAPGSVLYRIDVPWVV